MYVLRLHFNTGFDAHTCVRQAYQSGQFSLEPTLEQYIQEHQMEHGILAAIAEIASPTLFFIIACMTRWSFNAPYFPSFYHLTPEVFQRSMLYSLGNLGVAILTASVGLVYITRRSQRVKFREMFAKTVRGNFWSLFAALLGFMALQVAFMLTHYGIYPTFFSAL